MLMIILYGRPFQYTEGINESPNSSQTVSSNCNSDCSYRLSDEQMNFKLSQLCWMLRTDILYTGVTIVTVKSVLRRAFHKLNRSLGECAFRVFTGTYGIGYINIQRSIQKAPL